MSAIKIIKRMMRQLGLVTALGFLVIQGVAQETSPRENIGSGPTVPPAMTDRDLDERKLQLEREKFDFEKSRHSVWQDTVIPALSVAIPLLLGVATLLAQGRIARRLQGESAKNELALQEKSAKNALELKAIEIIMNSANTSAGYKRAKILKEIFPDIFSDDIVELFKDKDALPGVRYIDMKMELAKALAEANGIDKVKEILHLWGMVFHDENWINYLIGKWKEAYPGEDWLVELERRASPNVKGIDVQEATRSDRK